MKHQEKRNHLCTIFLWKNPEQLDSLNSRDERKPLSTEAKLRLFWNLSISYHGFVCLFKKSFSLCKVFFSRLDSILDFSKAFSCIIPNQQLTSFSCKGPSGKYFMLLVSTTIHLSFHMKKVAMGKLGVANCQGNYKTVPKMS